MRGAGPSSCHLEGVTACVHGSLTWASHGPAWIRERTARQAVGAIVRVRNRGWHARCSSGPTDIVRGSPLATRGGGAPVGDRGPGRRIRAREHLHRCAFLPAPSQPTASLRRSRTTRPSVRTRGRGSVTPRRRPSGRVGAMRGARERPGLVPEHRPLPARSHPRVPERGLIEHLGRDRRTESHGVRAATAAHRKWSAATQSKIEYARSTKPGM